MSKASKYKKEIGEHLFFLSEIELKALCIVLEDLEQSKNKEPVFAKSDLTFGSLEVLVQTGQFTRKVTEFTHRNGLYPDMILEAGLTSAKMFRMLTLLLENESANYKLRSIPFEPKPYPE